MPPHADFARKTRWNLALVTGSTAGIGVAIAEELVSNGADVIVNGRSPERVREAVYWS